MMLSKEEQAAWVEAGYDKAKVMAVMSLLATGNYARYKDTLAELDEVRYGVVEETVDGE